MNKQSKIITRNRVQLGRLFGRFGSNQNKFTISSVNKSTSSIVTSGSQTRMDVIYKHLSEFNNIANDEVLNLVQLVKMEHYDTESLFNDVGDGAQENSNILRSTKSQIFGHTLYQYIKYKIGIMYFIRCGIPLNSFCDFDIQCLRIRLVLVILLFIIKRA